MYSNGARARKARGAERCVKCICYQVGIRMVRARKAEGACECLGGHELIFWFRLSRHLRRKEGTSKILEKHDFLETNQKRPECHSKRPEFEWSAHMADTVVLVAFEDYGTTDNSATGRRYRTALFQNPCFPKAQAGCCDGSFVTVGTRKSIHGRLSEVCSLPALQA